MGRSDLILDSRLLRRGLTDNGYQELPLSGAHVSAIGNLPGIHKDPYHRMLVAQAQAEEITLLTADPVVAQYPGAIRSV